MATKQFNLSPLFESFEKIELDVSDTLSLDQENCFFYLEEGAVDVYRLEKIDETNNERNLFIHFFEAGDLLFNFLQKSKENTFPVFARILKKTTLRKIDLSSFHLQSADESVKAYFYQAVDRWILKVSEEISGGVEENPPTLVSKDETFILSKDLTVSFGFNIFERKQASVVWIHIEEGEVFFNEQQDFSLKAGQEVLPAPSLFNITAKEESKIRFLSSSTVFEEHDFFSFLNRFHEILLGEVFFTKKREEGLEKVRLLKRVAQEKETLLSAEYTLTSVLTDNSEHIIASSSDTIVKAIQMIMSSLKLKNLTVSLENADEMADNEKVQSICSQLDIGFRKVKLLPDFIHKDAGHFLSYIKETHEPVVIFQVKPGRYQVINPKTSEQKPITEEMAHQFTQEAYSFYKNLPENPTGLRLFKFILEGRGRDICTILGVSVFAAIISLYAPLSLGWIFDKAVPDHNYTYLFQLVAGLVMVTLGAQLFSLCRTFTFLRLEGKTSNKLQAALWQKLLACKLPFFRKYSIGDLFQRVSAVDEIRRLIGTSTLSSIISSFFSIFYLAIMFYRSKQLAAVMMIPVFLTLTVYIIAISMTIKRELKVLNTQAVIYGFFVQLLEAVKKIRVTGSENRVFARWAEYFAEKKSTELKLAAIHNWLRVSHEMITSFGTVLMYFVVILILEKVEKGGAAALAAKAASGIPMTRIGEFLSFSAAFGAFSSAVFGVGGSLLSVMKDIVPRWKRAKYVLESEKERKSVSRNVGNIAGNIVFENVSFRYSEKAPYIFKGLSFSLKSGDFVAFTGPSGCGKSTIIRLLLGFETATSGKIYIDGKDINNIDLVEFRKKMGVVLQHGAILGGSVRDNIKCSRNFTDEKIWETLKICGIEEEIRNLPMGLETLLPTGGGTLSSGQKQRLLIARALIAKPKILVLDEATSSLDNFTQEEIKKNIDRLNVSRIVVAHRLTTIENADNILVLNHGVVEQSGTFNELNSVEGTFQTLVKMQR